MEEKQNCIQTPVNKGTAQFCYKKHKMESYIPFTTCRKKQIQQKKKDYAKKKASLYKEGDLVAIQRTQFGAGLKLRPKFLGPYKVTKVNSKDRYEVEKVGQHDGPNSTATSADLMKLFMLN
ncbi:uncharacterized protein TNCV_3175111 [Trichonephila clavipes]|nr:uncharacterized protein TNCV_3175111 [Trichonephila clavipes]